MNGFLFLTCTCGLKIKIPPDFKQESLPCPRCGRELKIPSAELATVAAAAAAVSAGSGSGTSTETTVARQDSTQVYRRKWTGWESFTCSCGKVLQISPAFNGDKIVCSKCGTVTKIE